MEVVVDGRKIMDATKGSRKPNSLRKKLLGIFCQGEKVNGRVYEQGNSVVQARQSLCNGL